MGRLHRRAHSMSGNGKSRMGAVYSHLKEKASKAELMHDIREAFRLTDVPAEMLLLGLQTAGVKDIPAWVREHSLAPPRGTARKAIMKAAIAKVQQLGGLVLELAQNDPRLEVSYQQSDHKFSDEQLVPLKEFCDKVRDECHGGWKAKGKPGKGFNNKTIWRAMRV